MSVEIVSLVFGCILLLIGIIGGGFELKEFKVPKVSWMPRAAAGVAGVFFILVGISIYAFKAGPVEVAPRGFEEPSGQGGRARPTPRAASQMNFVIRDALGEDQVSEQVVVVINGRTVGTLSVNEHYPTAMLTVTVPGEGRYSYTVSGKAVFNDGGGLYEYAGVGQGMIDVEKGKSFDLAGGRSGSTWAITLRESDDD